VKWRCFWEWIRSKHLKKTKEVDPFPPHVIQELQALWEITVNKDRWDQKNKLWN
jgi:hypothetical protein